MPQPIRKPKLSNRVLTTSSLSFPFSFLFRLVDGVQQHRAYRSRSDVPSQTLASCCSHRQTKGNSLGISSRRTNKTPLRLLSSNPSNCDSYSTTPLLFESLNGVEMNFVFTVDDGENDLRSVRKSATFARQNCCSALRRKRVSQSRVYRLRGRSICML